MDRFDELIRWYSGNIYWTLVAFFGSILQCMWYLRRVELRQAPENHLQIEAVLGLMVTFEVAIIWFSYMSKPFMACLVQCMTRFVVDVVIIFSSLMLGRVSYDPPCQYLFRLRGFEETKVQTKTW